MRKAEREKIEQKIREKLVDEIKKAFEVEISEAGNFWDEGVPKDEIFKILEKFS